MGKFTLSTWLVCILCSAKEKKVRYFTLLIKIFDIQGKGGGGKKAKPPPPLITNFVLKVRNFIMKLYKS